MPFTIEQFFDVFEAYNDATAPAAVVLAVFAGIAAMAVVWPTPWSSRIVLAVLALLWAWSGSVYQLAFFTAVNPAAWAFGTAFIAEAVLLLWVGFRRVDQPFCNEASAKIVSAVLIIYALLLYPVLTAVTGHAYPRAPSFGAPCPVAIFSLGMLIWIRAPWYAAMIPIAWAIVGSSAAFYFGIYSDLGLIAAAAGFLLVRREHPTITRAA